MDEESLPICNGRAIARLCAREGAAVACADLHLGSAEETMRQIVDDEGGRGVAIAANASDEGDVERMVTEAVDGLGGLDGLVCNVGIGRGRDLDGTSAKWWDLVMSVNLRSHFLACKYALPAMQEGGSVVLISSVAGLTPGSHMPAYDASKAALEGLKRHVAIEGERAGVRVNVVAPGLIDTPLGRIATEGRPSRTKGRLPFGRQGTAWEVAQAVVFLLSDEASYVHAQTLAVDGGLTNRPYG